MEPLDHSDSTVNNTTPRRVLTLKRKSGPPAEDRPTLLEFIDSVENLSLGIIEKAWGMEPGASIRRELSEDALAVFRREIMATVGRPHHRSPELNYTLELLAETERLPRKINFDPVQQRRLMRLVVE